MSKIAKNTKKSTWTPLTNQATNNKIFEERRVLIGKWYDRWTDDQRKKILDDLVSKSKRKQLDYARDLINRRVTERHLDFTRTLPRVISLYILSFLDPRSLCRCSRVCWYWKFLSELDQLWMPKCLRLGWILTFSPSPYEGGVWKRNYVENIKSLQVLRPKETMHIDLANMHMDKRNMKEKKHKSKETHTLPWRGSDPVPQDIWRYNVLSNEDDVHTVNKWRKMKAYGSAVDAFSKSMRRSKTATGQSLNSFTRRSQSLSKLHASVTSMTSPDRPQWAIKTSQLIGRQNGEVSAVVRPKPVSTPKTPRSARALTSTRSERDPPTTDLFPDKPWVVPDQMESDED
ncbi:F-box only protein 16-like [Gigantopelta aegis]|uniref:F-box only protein 16-like n=1 Tax=Gigantopelta aegis TaxID=1735272 RepID=UPI001B88B144|nr:F-box only protein 16-like [Gigantopelta aegis]